MDFYQVRNGWNQIIYCRISLPANAAFVTIIIPNSRREYVGYECLEKVGFKSKVDALMFVNLSIQLRKAIKYVSDNAGRELHQC